MPKGSGKNPQGAVPKAPTKPANKQKSTKGRKPPSGGSKPKGPARSANWSPWFVLGEASIDASTPPGVLFQLVLHPSVIGGPYRDVCANYTHRRERWEVAVHMTTAVTTGARIGCAVLQDPSLTSQAITPDLLRGLCMGQLGRFCDTSGTSSETKLTTSTSQKLSNASPTAENWVGYSQGVVVLGLVDPPIAVQGTSVIRCTVMGRVDLQPEGPLAGFMAWEGTTPGPPTPGGAAWQLQVTHRTDHFTLNSHPGTAWLAGGEYWDIFDGGFTGGIHVLTGIYYYAVYVSDHLGEDWENNSSQRFDPHYYVTWAEPGAYRCMLVGFTSLRDAQRQADGETGAVPSGVELCISYSSGTVAVGDRFAGLADGAKVNFHEVYRGKHAAPITAGALRPPRPVPHTEASVQSSDTRLQETAVTALESQHQMQQLLAQMTQLLSSWNMQASSAARVMVMDPSSEETSSWGRVTDERPDESSEGGD